jgi:hypothetical protein
MNGFQLNEPSTSNELFLERLDAFTEKTLADIKAFSARENIPYDQVGYDPTIPHRTIPEHLYLRFGVTSQKDIQSTFSETRPFHQHVSRTVRLGGPPLLCFLTLKSFVGPQSVTFFCQLPACWSLCKLRLAFNHSSSRSTLMTQKTRASSAGAR